MVREVKTAMGSRWWVYDEEGTEGSEGTLPLCVIGSRRRTRSERWGGRPPLGQSDPRRSRGSSVLGMGRRDTIQHHSSIALQ